MSAHGLPVLPVVLEDGTRFDWSEAEYEPIVTVGTASAWIHHRLNRAPRLARLVSDGLAKWATEFRCPKTLHSRVEEASDVHQEVTWSSDDVDGEAFLIPGLLAVTDLSLRDAAQDLVSIWRDHPLQVARGWWLARGQARRIARMGQSLLRFKMDKALADGRMRIQCSAGGEDLCFHVHLAQDVWPERQYRHVWMAALIGALGHMPRLYPDEDHDMPRIVGEMRQRLKGAGVPIWTQSDYDPAQAATAIEQFHPSQPDAD